MKQLRYDDYGGIPKMYLAEIPTPAPTDHDVHLVVEVKAAGINPVDWKIRNGHLKIGDGHQWPRRMGCEFAGVVHTLPLATTESTTFTVGQEVYGWLNFKKLGAMAEYVLVEPHEMHPKPLKLSMSEAAGLPMVGATAINAFRRQSSVGGKHILINGASGGLGHLAIQLARIDGAAHITATAGPDHQEFMRELGAHRTINYQKTDVRQEEKTYDVILDCASNIGWSTAKKMLRPNGDYINLNPGLGDIVGSFFANRFGGKNHHPIMTEADRGMLHQLYELVQDHDLNVHVGREYKLDDFARAYTEMENGNAPQGKAVLVP